MGSKSAPSSPSSGTGASEPVKKTETKCPETECWTADAEKSISVNSYGRYFKKYKNDGTEYSYTFNKKYKLIAPAKTGTKVTVEVRFKPEPQEGVTEDAATEAKKKLENGVDTHWNNKFTLVAEDPECPSKTFKIVYKIVWVESGHDYVIKIHDTYPREGLSGSTMNVAKDTSDWVYAHEFAHCVGLPDEYSYSTEDETVKYIKPDGTLDSAVSAPPFKAKTEPDATIMSSHSNNTTKKRHAWNIAIETQELLTSKLGRTIKCKIT